METEQSQQTMIAAGIARVATVYPHPEPQPTGMSPLRLSNPPVRLPSTVAQKFFRVDERPDDLLAGLPFAGQRFLLRFSSDFLLDMAQSGLKLARLGFARICR